MRSISSLAIALIIAVIACLQPRLASAQGLPDPPQQVIVKWIDGVSLGNESPRALEAIDGAQRYSGITVTLVRTLANGAEVFRVAEPADRISVDGFVSLIRYFDAVTYAEHDIFVTPALNPGDPLFDQAALDIINAPEAWDTSTGAGTVVAVLDTGYVQHEDLNANLLPGYDFISDAALSNDGDGRDADAQDTGSAAPANCTAPLWHGTRVAGAIAAVGQNSIGIAGTAFGAKLVPIRVMSRCGGFISDVADAIVHAAGGTVPGVPANANPAKVINLSLSGYGSCGETLGAAVLAARQRGAVVVAAAGNFDASALPGAPNASPDAAHYTPGNCGDVISVAAVDARDRKLDISTSGRTVDFSAPGEMISTTPLGETEPGGDAYEGYRGGTSIAAAVTSGAAALLLAQKPTLNLPDLTSALRDTTRRFAFPCEGCGSGRLDAAAALAALAQFDARPLPPTDLQASPSPTADGRYEITWRHSLFADAYQIETSVELGVWSDRRTVNGELSQRYAQTTAQRFAHRVRAINGARTSDWAVVTVDYKNPALQPRTAPGRFRADETYSLDGNILLSWDAVADIPGYPIDYVISHNSNTADIVTRTSQVNVPGLDTGVHIFSIAARNWNGVGPSSGVLTVRVNRAPPNPPGPISTLPADANSHDRNYSYSWMAVPDAQYYEYERGILSPFGGRTRVDGTSVSFTNQSELDAKFRLRAVNVNGASAWTEAPVIHVRPPLPPRSISGPTQSSGTYTVTWPQASGADRYELQRCPRGTVESCSGGVIVSGLSYTFRNQPAGNPKHRLRSYRNDRIGEWGPLGAEVIVCPAHCQ